MKNKPWYLALFLAVVSAIAGGALAFANNLTQPVIKANEEKQEKESLLVMYPEASLDDFTTVNAEDITPDHPEIQAVYKYKDRVIVFKCQVSGYDGGTVFLVGIDPASDTVDAFEAISNGDTKGIGSRITGDEFKNSVTGQKASDHLDTLSGATITSTPVVEAINDCATVAGEIE